MKLWLTPSEAAIMLTEQSGHPVTAEYVRRLGNAGRIRTKPLSTRMKLYHAHDIAKITVRENKRVPHL